MDNLFGERMTVYLTATGPLLVRYLSATSPMQSSLVLRSIFAQSSLILRSIFAQGSLVLRSLFAHSSLKVRSFFDTHSLSIRFSFAVSSLNVDRNVGHRLWGRRATGRGWMMARRGRFYIRCWRFGKKVYICRIAMISSHPASAICVNALWIKV